MGLTIDKNIMRITHGYKIRSVLRCHSGNWSPFTFITSLEGAVLVSHYFGLDIIPNYVHGGYLIYPYSMLP